MNIELIQDACRWNAYTDNFPEASIYHGWAWGQLVEETFGHQAHYLAASSGGAIQGVLPFVNMKSRLFGQFLVSMPFSSYGGVLAMTTEARNALLEEAARFAQQTGARYVEMRQGAACDVQWLDKTPKVTMVVELPGSVEELWNRLSTGMRNKIRNARKQGLRIEWGHGEMVDTFYRIFSRNMRDLGTPVYPKRWFENLCRRLPNEAEIVTVWDGLQPVGAGLTISHGQTLEFPWSSTLRESRKKYSAVLMYWDLQERAVQRGYRRVDFGRSSPGSGTHEFKRHWTCQEIPLHWYYWLPTGAAIPELHRENPRYRLAAQVWKRLPVPVANWLGPHVVRAIP
jgi:FemAB-related protein (PEP-CTERM system-associated)